MGQNHTGFLFISTIDITEGQASSSKYGVISAKLQVSFKNAEDAFFFFWQYLHHLPMPLFHDSYKVNKVK